jgi:hypothetical protein
MNNPLIIAGGGIVPEQPKTKLIIGNVYAFSVEYGLKRVGEVSFGLAGNFSAKKSHPFADQYFQYSEIGVLLTGYGIGPSFAVEVNKALRLGGDYSLYYLILNYPSSGHNSSVTTISEKRIAGGIRLYADVMPLSFGRYSIGFKLGMQGVGYGNLDYYSYEEQDVFDQFSISGLFAQITMARR